MLRRPAAGRGRPPGGPGPAGAGSSKLHTLAAVMTPAAKPSMARWNWGRGSSAKKNTTAAPRVVIRKVKPVPSAAQINACNIHINAFSPIQAEFCLYASIGTATEDVRAGTPEQSAAALAFHRELCYNKSEKRKLLI